MKFVIGIDEAGRGPLAGPVTVGSFGTTEKTAKLILKNFFDGKLRDSKKLSEKKREEIFAKLSLLKKEGSVSFEVAHSTPKMIDKKGISMAVNNSIHRSLSTLVQKCTDIFLLKNSSSSRQSRSLGISGSSVSEISELDRKSVSSKIQKCLARLTEPSTRKNSAEFYPCISELDTKEISYLLEIRLDGLLKAPPEFKKQKTIIKGDENDIFIACASIVAKVSRDRLMCKLAKKYPLYGFEIHKGYGTASHRNLIKTLGPSLIHRRSFCKNVI